MRERMDLMILALLVAALILSSTIAAVLVGLVFDAVPVALALGVGVGSLAVSVVVALTIRGRYARLAPPDREEDVTE